MRAISAFPGAAVGVALVLLLAGCADGSGSERTAPTVGSSAYAMAREACGWRQPPPRTWSHVIWIWMENTSYRQIIGSGDAPYINALAKRCGLATDFRSETHPSLPNYLASVSGTTGGVTSDCDPEDCPQHAPTLFQQVRDAGGQWRVYAESMPENCASSNEGRYAVRHTAAPYYRALAATCEAWQVPMGTTSSGALHDALAGGKLPAFSFVVPNTCNDMHDCSVRTGDAWLSEWMSQILASPDYRSGGTAVFLTWDEGEDGSHGQSCLGGDYDETCHIPTLVISPPTQPGTRSGMLFTHYSMLRTTEEMLGITSYLGHAKEASSMRHAFGL